MPPEQLARRRLRVEKRQVVDGLDASVIAQEFGHDMGVGVGALHAQALADGMMPLLGDGLARVVAGVTSAEEVLRVVQDG